MVYGIYTRGIYSLLFYIILFSAPIPLLTRYNHSYIIKTKRKTDTNKINKTLKYKKRKKHIETLKKNCIIPLIQHTEKPYEF